MKDNLSEDELLELQRLMTTSEMGEGISELVDINQFLEDGLITGEKE